MRTGGDAETERKSSNMLQPEQVQRCPTADQRLRRATVATMVLGLGG